MSNNLRKVSTYLKLLLDLHTTKEQRYGLLYTASTHQIRALVEVIHNLLHGNLQLNQKTKTLISKRRKILENFADTKYSLKSKTRSLKTHYRYFSEVLYLTSKLILPNIK